MKLYSLRQCFSLRPSLKSSAFLLLAVLLIFFTFSSAFAASDAEKLSSLLNAELQLDFSKDQLGKLPSGVREQMLAFFSFVHIGNSLFVGPTEAEKKLQAIVNGVENALTKDLADVAGDMAWDSVIDYLKYLAGNIETKLGAGNAAPLLGLTQELLTASENLLRAAELVVAMNEKLQEEIVYCYILHRDSGKNDEEAWQEFSKLEEGIEDFIGAECNVATKNLEGGCDLVVALEKGGEPLRNYARQTYEAHKLAQRLSSDVQLKESLKQWVNSEVEKAQNAKIEQPSFFPCVVAAITTTVVKVADAVQTFVTNGVQVVANSVKAAWTDVKEFFTGATSQKDEVVIQPSDLSGQVSNALSSDANKAVPDLSQEGNTLSQTQEEQRQVEEQRTKTATPVQLSNPSDQLKSQPTQQPSPTTTQVKTINLRYKTGCDKNWGSPIPFVSLDWDVSYENMTSQTIYRNNEVILNAPPSVGPSYFDGTIKAGRTYNYVIKAEYKDGYSNSAEANAVVPIDVCGPINPVQNETPASQPPPTSPAPSPPQKIPPSTSPHASSRWGKVSAFFVDKNGSPINVYWQLGGILTNYDTKEVVSNLPQRYINSKRQSIKLSGNIFDDEIFDDGANFSSYYNETLPNGKYKLIFYYMDSRYSSGWSCLAIWRRVYTTTLEISDGSNIELGEMIVDPDELRKTKLDPNIPPEEAACPLNDLASLLP